MSTQTILPARMRLEIEVEGPSSREKYITSVIRCTHDELRIQAPLSASGERILLPQGTAVGLACAAENGAYVSKTRCVVKGAFEHPTAGYVLSFPVQFEHVQRREFFRLQYSGKVDYRVVRTPDGRLAPTDSPFKTTTFIDISGGGVKLHATREILIGSSLQVKLVLEGLAPTVLQAKAVYVAPAGGDRGGFEVGVCFENIARGYQDQIIRWVFDKEREIRRSARELV